MIDSFRGEWAFLSNFTACEIEFEGMRFRSTEAAFQAAKTLNTQERQRFVNAGPVEAKKMGRLVTLRADWDSIRVGVMENLLRQKFQHAGLKARLLSTGTETLVEGNTWNDKFWGVCRGVGQNNLGKLLMKIRAEIQSQE